MAFALQDSPPAAQDRLRTAVVERIRRLTEDTAELTLAAADPQAAPIEAGAHVRVDFGAGLVRCYSLCNAGERAERYVIAVKREPGSRGGSAAAHALAVGARVRVSAPINRFEPDWRESRHLLIAGGIGITPLYAMAQAALHRGHDFVLHYFVRDTGHAAFLAELNTAPFAGHLRLHAGLDADAVRARTADIVAEAGDNEGIYVCGPAPLIELVRTQAAARLPVQRIHWESFGGDDSAATAEGDAPFEIAIASGEGPFVVPPGQSALSVLLAAGVDAPFSCREGECGMCVVDVIEGIPDHRDRFLSDAVRAKNGCMALCVSRARSPRIVVDL
ncbi:Phenoxybenzoate dioxygenase subunit beta [Variovorax sp. SRS16]|uniref:PDR/VanB family oxidoreductase n=1 Tax=Variovorax sp. SRS16 TaxID=282217 RepID=UPI0013166033|nr:PDR/VanB family oxidoreductase [Variovorax sp. SRS16]VTU14883.1 Phenoxybenzoate dioxygenase subunit beta [Variovorax sp. SRS16]